MLRHAFATFASLLLITACGDDGGTPTTSSATDTGTSTTDDTGTSTSTTNPTTTTDPTTTLEPTSTTTEDTTGPADPTTTTDPTATSTIGPDETTTTIDTLGTTLEPETSTTDGDPVQQCLEMVDPGDMCGECACTNCTEDLQACQADEGCTAIRECAQESGCSGLDCIGPCGAVINQYGGVAGPSAGLAQALAGCVGGACSDRCGL